jgi:hypothetical protein
MSEHKGNVVIDERGQESDPLEIILDDLDTGKCKISLPLSCDLELSSVTENGKGMPISSVEICDTRTIIKVPPSAPHWRLKVMNPPGPSPHDSAGTSSNAGDDESGDRFSLCALRSVDWLSTGDHKTDKETQKIIKRVQTARREIVIQKQGTPKSE